MSTDLERWIEAGFAAFNRRDWDTIADGLPQHFEFHDNVPPDAIVERGPYAMKAITDANGDMAFAGLQMNPIEIELLASADDRTQVLVRVSASAAGGSSAAPVRAEIAALWTLENGTLVRIEQFRSWDDARDAAGT